MGSLLTPVLCLSLQELKGGKTYSKVRGLDDGAVDRVGWDGTGMTEAPTTPSPISAPKRRYIRGIILEISLLVVSALNMEAAYTCCNTNGTEDCSVTRIISVPLPLQASSPDPSTGICFYLLRKKKKYIIHAE